jgi:hypothetical protein
MPADHFDVTQTFGEISVSRSARVVSRALVILAAVVFFAYQLSPDEKSAVRDFQQSSEYVEGVKVLRKNALESGRSQTAQFLTRGSLLTNLTVLVIVEIKGGLIMETAQGIPIARIDRLVIFGGLFAALILVVWFGAGQIKIFGAPTFRMAAPAVSVAPLVKTAVDLFALEVTAAEERAQILLSRSTLLLGAGIIMAFVGVAVFYVTLPEATRDDRYPDYLFHAIRPTGVLIFLEAIAWFLLRQYRALIEDYKWFHRLYLKRANYLAAIRLFEKEVVRPEDVFVAASLIREDLSGRLQKGETTEGLEALKQGEDDPVSQLIKTIASLRNEAAKRGPASKGDTN